MVLNVPVTYEMNMCYALIFVKEMGLRMACCPAAEEEEKWLRDARGESSRREGCGWDLDVEIGVCPKVALWQREGLRRIVPDHSPIMRSIRPVPINTTWSCILFFGGGSLWCCSPSRISLKLVVLYPHHVVGSSMLEKRISCCPFPHDCFFFDYASNIISCICVPCFGHIQVNFSVVKSWWIPMCPRIKCIMLKP